MFDEAEIDLAVESVLDRPASFLSANYPWLHCELQHQQMASERGTSRPDWERRVPSESFRRQLVPAGCCPASLPSGGAPPWQMRGTPLGGRLGPWSQVSESRDRCLE